MSIVPSFCEFYRKVSYAIDLWAKAHTILPKTAVHEHIWIFFRRNIAVSIFSKASFVYSIIIRCLNWNHIENILKNKLITILNHNRMYSYD